MAIRAAVLAFLLIVARKLLRAPGQSNTPVSTPRVSNKRNEENEPYVRRYGRILVMTAATLSVLGILILTLRSMTSGMEPGRILRCALVAAFCSLLLALLATIWYRGRQSTALGLAIVSVSLGTVALAATVRLTSPLTAPDTVGGIYLMLPAGSPPVTFQVSLSREGYASLATSCIIDRADVRHSLRYAILFTRDGRMTPNAEPKRQVREVPFDNIAFDPGRDYYEPTQGSKSERGYFDSESEILVGELPAGASRAFIDGTHSARYVAKSPSRALGVLPVIGVIDTDNFSPDEEGVDQRIADAIGFSPVSTDVVTEVTVSDTYSLGGELMPDEALVQSSPAAQGSNQLDWKSDRPLMRPTFTVLSQHADDTLRNALFVLAILLGVAGSGLIASLQSFSQVLLQSGGR